MKHEGKESILFFSSTFREEALLLDGFLGDIDSRNPAINPYSLEKQTDLHTPFIVISEQHDKQTNKQTNRKTMKKRPERWSRKGRLVCGMPLFLQARLLVPQSWFRRGKLGSGGTCGGIFGRKRIFKGSSIIRPNTTMARKSLGFADSVHGSRDGTRCQR